MKRRAWLLALVLLWALPGRTLADSHHLFSWGHYSSTCGIPVRDDDAFASSPLKCVTGVAVKISWNSMKVRPAHGNPLQVRFTDATLFETDSGEGVLDGLVAGDYVCVSYMPHGGTGTALLVLFDPETMPCRFRKHVRM